MLNIYTKHPAENLWPIFSDSSQTEHCEQLSIQSEFLVTSFTSTNDLAPPPGKLYMGRLCPPPPYPLSISLLTEEVSFHVPSTEEYPLPLGPCSSQVTPPLTITTSLRELTVPML